ncbi:hypothetical protein TNCV_2759241 [Trichonephila clavipes]|nr:hypothetical protein TNCV_2759241 [Trichonephila clavipes]
MTRDGGGTVVAAQIVEDEPTTSETHISEVSQFIQRFLRMRQKQSDMWWHSYEATNFAESHPGVGPLDSSFIFFATGGWASHPQLKSYAGRFGPDQPQTGAVMLSHKGRCKYIVVSNAPKVLYS